MTEPKIEYENEVVLPRRVRQQRDNLPALWKEGDCGACVLAGVLDLPDLKAAYELTDEGKIEPFSHTRLYRALHAADRKGLVDRLITEVPSWSVYQVHQTWGSPAWLQNLDWFYWLRMGIDAGYYGLASVDADHRGPLKGRVNHIVLIVGTREEIEHKTMKSSVDGNFINYSSHTPQVLISCSSTKSVDEEWVNVRDYLMWWGGFNIQLVRPLEKNK